MKNTKRFLAILVALAALALPAGAYDNAYTHPDLTAIAARKSVLYQDGSIMFSLGLLPAGHELFLYSYRNNWFRYGLRFYTLAGIIGEGAFDEDSDTTPRHHFYDPHFDRALTFGSNHKSWEWALEEPETDAFQNWSLRDARQHLRDALTFNFNTPVRSDEERRGAMDAMFLSLGHVVHHLQDMAQPQHVRDDMHLDLGVFNYSTLGLLLSNPSRYEAYTKEQRPGVRQIADGAPALDFRTEQIRTAREFWSNDAGTGVAQRTNREFVSHGTNFIEGVSTGTRGNYPAPLQGLGTEYTVQELFDEEGAAVPAGLQQLCGTPAIACTMIMVATDTTPKASSFSIFDQDLQRNDIVVQWGFPPVLTRVLYSLNRFNFRSAHTVLIDRAVSYSAGFIDHFFRGRLEVLRPDTGAWAVVDHGSANGFTEIRARVKNATPNEALQNGTIRAIAKFHRNNCYQPDLSGEFRVDENGGLIVPCRDYRSEESHIRVTAAETAAFGVDEMKDMTFTFSDPIPFDATDLILQVYFEGEVGMEEASFALGAADLSEPTYFAIMNATDVFEVNATAFYYPEEIIAGITRGEFPFSLLDLDGNQEYNSPPDVDIRGGDIAYEVYLDGEKFGDVTLPEGRFARIAALVDPNGAVLSLIARGNGFNTFNNYSFGAKSGQYDPERNAFLVSPVDYLRNHTLQFNSVSYFHYYPTTGAPLEDMPASRAADATAAIPVIPVP